MGYSTSAAAPASDHVIRVARPPLAPHPGDAERAESGELQDGSGTETVLLVEDDPSVRRVAGRFLALGGYTVLAADDVHDALRFARDHPAPIHLLLSDIVMPGMNGPDLAQRIIEWRPEVRVLYVSGYSDTLGGPFVDGRVRLVRKPFSVRDLLTAVRQTLERR